ncbi:MAG: hypothetical protein GIKADHBN_02212 [Phycisphaerales bacterium]|nr:hypothetical protein [Phycisphaerales bacterium]
MLPKRTLGFMVLQNPWLLVVAGGICRIATAQPFNLDIAPSDAILPGVEYAGAANQAGLWNRVDGSSGVLRDVNGNLTSSQSGLLGGLLTTTSITGADPGDKELMESVFFGDRIGSAQAGVSNLAPGPYRIYVYAWQPPDSPLATQSRIAINETTSGTSLVVETVFGGGWSGHSPGMTYATADINVVASSGLLLFGLLSLGNGEDSPVSVLNGIQIVPIPAPTTAVMVLVLLPLASCRRR